MWKVLHDVLTTTRIEGTPTACVNAGCDWGGGYRQGMGGIDRVWGVQVQTGYGIQVYTGYGVQVYTGYGIQVTQGMAFGYTQGMAFG